MARRIKKYKESLKLLAQLLVVVVIGWLMFERLQAGFYQAVNEASLTSWQIFVSIIFFTLAVLVSGVLWSKIIRQLDPSFRRINITEAIRVHTVSWLLKYIPGQVGTLLSKMAWGSSNEISKKTVASSLLYENIFLASSSVILSIPVIGFSVLRDFGADVGLLLPLIMALAVLPLLIPGVLIFAVNIVFKLLKKKPFDQRHVLAGKQILQNQLLYLVPRIINGIGFVLIVSLFYEPSLFESIQLIGAYALAGIIGILAVFVPSGLGVREAVIIIVAGPIIGADLAAAAAIIARFSASLADVMLAFIYFIIRRTHGKS